MKNAVCMRTIRNLTALLLALVLLAGCTCAVAETVPDHYEGAGFDAPEDAALYYLAGLKNMDLGQMLSAFAWETLAERYDYKAMITRAKGTDPYYVPGMPVFNDLSRSANVELLRDEQTGYICRALEYYINDELFNSSTGFMVFNEDSELDEYLQRCDNGKIDRLAAMTNIRFYTPDDVTDGRFSMERSYQNFLKQTAQYGADEVTAVFAAADIDGITYAISPVVARYGDKWYMVNMFSSVTSFVGIESNKQSFYDVPAEVMERLKNATPYFTATDLPSGNRKTPYEGQGFSSPEEAVNFYFDGLKNGNVQQMLQAFAWETQADRYSLKEYAYSKRYINMDAPVRMQFDNAFMRELNLGSLRYSQNRVIYNAIRLYILEDEEKAANLINGYRIDMKEEDEINAFIKCFDNGKADKLKRLGNVRLMDPETLSERYNTDPVRKRLETLGLIYGADEIKETLAFADLDGETLAVNPILVRYGDRWYIASFEGITFSILAVEVNRRALLHIKEPAETLLQLLKQ